MIEDSHRTHFVWGSSGKCLGRVTICTQKRKARGQLGNYGRCSQANRSKIIIFDRRKLTTGPRTRFSRSMSPMILPICLMHSWTGKLVPVLHRRLSDPTHKLSLVRSIMHQLRHWCSKLRLHEFHRGVHQRSSKNVNIKILEKRFWLLKVGKFIAFNNNYSSIIADDEASYQMKSVGQIKRHQEKKSCRANREIILLVSCFNFEYRDKAMPLGSNFRRSLSIFALSILLCEETDISGVSVECMSERWLALLTSSLHRVIEKCPASFELS